MHKREVSWAFGCVHWLWHIVVLEPCCARDLRTYKTMCVFVAGRFWKTITKKNLAERLLAFGVHSLAIAKSSRFSLEHL